jgi:alkylation response protein AidB-like acyl-CoA dehydrogenase
MTGTGSPDAQGLAEYRERAAQWLADNLERRADGSTNIASFGAHEHTVEEIAEGRKLQRRLHEAGYAGITWPEEYGGQGLDAAHERVFQEEARGFVLPDLGIGGGASLNVCAPTMLAHGSTELLTSHIPRILSGEEIVVQFFSDPEAGSDLAGVRTQAVKDGDRWILNGSKVWSSGAYYADFGLCLARTDWDAPKHRGLTWFLVPTNAPGITVERIRQVNGNAEFCQEFFDDVELRDEDILGTVNDGWTVTHTMLLYERGGNASSHAGPAPGMQPELRRLADDVDAWADATSRDLLIQAYVDDLARAALGSRLGAVMAADPQAAVNLASYGKLAAGVFDPIRANLMMRLAGTSALAWDDHSAAGAAVSLALLNSRFMAIAGGTLQMQRNTIGERVLGLPREPSFDTTIPFRDVIKNARNWSGKVS